MISFFRRIRQELLQQKSVTRYFAYAIGEILLVVIGILIALQVNNWNEVNKNSKQEKAFLINFHEDLRSDSLHLQEIKETLKTAVAYKRVFESHMDGEITDPEKLF